MIARVWRGATRATDAAAYAAYVGRCLEGERALVLQRVDGERAEIETIIFFDSLADVAAFAGDEVERARCYPEDNRYLVERELNSASFRRAGIYAAVEVDARVRTGAPEPAVVGACAQRERLQQ